MRKKSSSIDLTPLLDVILIFLFLALMINAGELLDVRALLEESEEQLAFLESEQEDTRAALADANERLSALSDWDNDRLGLLNDIEKLTYWKEVAEGEANFLSISVNEIAPERFIIVTSPNEDVYQQAIEFAAVGNSIANEEGINEFIYNTLSTIIESFGNEQPFFIIFDRSGSLNMEVRLIDRAVNMYKTTEVEDESINIYFTPSR